MGSKLKNFLKKFLPPSAKASKGYTDTLLWRLDEIEKRIADIQAENAKRADETAAINRSLSEIIASQRLLSDEIISCREAIASEAKAVKDIADNSANAIRSLTEDQGDRIVRELDAGIKGSNELIKDQIKAASELIEERFNSASDLIESAKDDLEGEIFAAREKESALADAREAAIIGEIRENSDRACAAIKAQSKNISEKIDEASKNSDMISQSNTSIISEKIIQLGESSRSIVEAKTGKIERALEQKAQAMVDTVTSAKQDVVDAVASVKRDISADATEAKNALDSKTASVLLQLKDTERAVYENVSPKIEALSESLSLLSEQANDIQKTSSAAKRSSEENVWANVFNNTTEGSWWLKERNFSPGRWAVGYQYLYVMFRILDEAKPKRILDIGLGQTSKMLSQYAAANDDVQHIVIEDNAAWAEFFKSKNALSERTKIHLLELATTQFRDCKSIRSYEGFAETLANQKFDFISIDAPIGSDNPKYSRVDILKILPDCLNSDFAIMIDDFERDGERRTFYAIKDLLTQSGIPCHTTGYIGANKLGLITSSSWTFLNSL